MPACGPSRPRACPPRRPCPPPRGWAAAQSCTACVYRSGRSLRRAPSAAFACRAARAAAAPAPACAAAIVTRRPALASLLVYPERRRKQGAHRKPMSSRRSASSSTSTFSSLMHGASVPLARWSLSRPGVATSTSGVRLRSRSSSLCTLVPPNITCRPSHWELVAEGRTAGVTRTC